MNRVEKCLKVGPIMPLVVCAKNKGTIIVRGGKGYCPTGYRKEKLGI